MNKVESERDHRHREAFGENTNISQCCRERIYDIKDNDPDLTEFSLERYDAERFTDLAWELLGGYIANNEYLVIIRLRGLADSKLPLFFPGLSGGSHHIKNLDLSSNELGIDGVRNMVPFLKKARNLSKLDIGHNGAINSECVRMLVGALQIGGAIEELWLESCDIDDITALEHHPLPRLRILDLDRNNIQSFPSSMENYTNLEERYLRNNKIGVKGCQSIARLLEKDASNLKELNLYSNNLGDEEAEIIANSLKCNTSLMDLYLGGNNNFTEKAFNAFSKLLNDVSSMDGTYNSNHTLTKLVLPESTNSTVQEMRRHIESAIQINKGNDGNSHAAGRAKVIYTQLNSQKRKELCRLQRVDYSYGSIFAEIEPILLPEVIALVGGKHGQRELYRVLLATAPYLTSAVNKEIALKERIEENAALTEALDVKHSRQTAALTAKHLRETAALASKHLGETAALAAGTGSEEAESSSSISSMSEAS